MTDATVVTLQPKASTSNNVGVAVTFEVRTQAYTRSLGTTSPHQDVSFSLTKRTLRGRKVVTLLEDISGFLQPGTLTALLGPSGCGKTTLLDVLAGRKTQGSIEGTVLYAGEVPSRVFMRRHTGYCEQQGRIPFFVQPWSEASSSLCRHAHRHADPLRNAMLHRAAQDAAEHVQTRKAGACQHPHRHTGAHRLQKHQDWHEPHSRHLWRAGVCMVVQ